ncbi:MAG: hypothetical protein ABEI13_02760 [Candidatus Paceibacteria bacterium]
MAINVAEFRKLTKDFEGYASSLVPETLGVNACLEVINSYSSQDVAAIFFHHRDHSLLNHIRKELYDEIASIWQEVDESGGSTVLQKYSDSGKLATIDPQDEMAQIVFYSDSSEAACNELLNVVFQCDDDKIQEYVEQPTDVGRLGAILATQYLKEGQEITQDIAIKFGFKNVSELKEELHKLPDTLEINEDLEEIFVNTKEELAELEEQTQEEIF